MRHPNHSRSRRPRGRSVGDPPFRVAVGLALLGLAGVWTLLPGHGAAAAADGDLLTWPLRQGGAPVLVTGLGLLVAAGVLGAVGAAGRRLARIGS